MRDASTLTGPADRPGISRPPTTREIVWDRTFRVLTHFFSWFLVVLVFAIICRIGWGAAPAIGKYGVGFLTGTQWDANKDTFAVLPAIWGTLYSSILALIIGTFFGVAVAIFLSERLLSLTVFGLLKVFGLQFHRFWGSLPDQAEGLVRNLVQLLAAIPSVVYGLWGLYLIQRVHIFNLAEPSLLPASLVLAIMILPTISAISYDALVAVPPKLREAAYGLGATRWEAVLGVIMPSSIGGIFGAVVLAFGRALGETMALLMLAGNGPNLTLSLFKPVQTLAALLASNFSDPSENVLPSLMYAALVLLAITLVVNMLGALIISRTGRSMKGART